MQHDGVFQGLVSELELPWKYPRGNRRWRGQTREGQKGQETMRNRKSKGKGWEKVSDCDGEEKKRKERPGFLLVNSGFLGNDWAVMVLSLNSPNETRGPASVMMFISLHFSSFFFHLWHKNHIYRICISFVWQPTVSFHFFFSSATPNFFLHIQQSPRAKAGICGLLTNGGDIF